MVHNDITIERQNQNSCRRSFPQKTEGVRYEKNYITDCIDCTFACTLQLQFDDNLVNNAVKMVENELEQALKNNEIFKSLMHSGFMT